MWQGGELGALVGFSVATLGGRARPGVVIHRVARLDARDTTLYHGIPITTVPRVLLDVAPAFTLAELTRACHEAWVHHRTGPPEIKACIARNPSKPGGRHLLRAVGTDVTLSALEDAFLALPRSHGLPVPRTNIDRHGDKVDCHWPRLRLTVELVSYRFHDTRQAFERDVGRRRRSHHIAFSYGDVTERSERTAAEVAQLIARASVGDGTAA